MILGSAARVSDRSPPASWSRMILPSLRRSTWERAMLDTGHADQNARWFDLILDPLMRNRAETLAREKYAQAEFTQKR